MSDSWWEENKLENNPLVDIRWLKEELRYSDSLNPLRDSTFFPSIYETSFNDCGVKVLIIANELR
jgi:hypothetical protein